MWCIRSFLYMDVHYCTCGVSHRRRRGVCDLLSVDPVVNIFLHVTSTNTMASAVGFEEKHWDPDLRCPSGPLLDCWEGQDTSQSTSGSRAPVSGLVLMPGFRAQKSDRFADPQPLGDMFSDLLLSPESGHQTRTSFVLLFTWNLWDAIHDWDRDNRCPSGPLPEGQKAKRLAFRFLVPVHHFPGSF